MFVSQRSGDLASATLLVLLGLATLVAAAGIPEGAGGQLHPRTFPLLLGAVLVIGGASLGIRALWFPLPSSKRIEWPDLKGWKRWWLALALVSAYVAFSIPLGFVLSSLCFVVAFTKIFGRYRWTVVLGCGLGTAGLVYLLFVRLLDLTLPLGPFSILAH